MSGFQFIEPNEAIPQKPLFVVVSGIPGIGKTSAAFTAGECMVVDADMGIQRAIQTKRPLAVRIQQYRDFRAQVLGAEFEVMVRQRGIKNIILDTVGALLDDIIAPYLIQADNKNSRAGGLSLQGWGSLATEFNLLIERFFSLGLNVLAIAHGKDDEDEATKAKLITLAVKGGSREVILRKADMVGFIQLRNGMRVLDFNKSANVFVAKNTAMLPALEIPHADTPGYQTFMAEILEKTKAAMGAMSEAQMQAVRLQKLYSDKISELVSLADVPQLQAEIEGLELETVKAGLMALLGARYAEIVMDSFEPKNAKAVNEFVKALSAHPDAYKKVIWGRLVDTARQLGFAYDKTSKTFKAVKGEPAETEQPAETETTETEATDGEA